jgi:pimeloyl-ACP methyl ester carboxylesterase
VGTADDDAGLGAATGAWVQLASGASATRKRTNRVRFTRKALLTTGWVLALAGCVTPAEQSDRAARALGLRPGVVRGQPYLHATYAPDDERPSGAAREPSSVPLHVYLGGDGSPRGALRWRPADPTPDPIVLRLLALDPAPRVYLGRPCYHAVSPCDSWLLGLGRYSEAVVTSMAAAVEGLRAPGQPVVLLGHSGGGTLAMLLAARLQGVRAVVTVAGNLDVGAWTSLHGFEPLRGSLDPAREPPLPQAITQLHVAGALDENVPVALTRAALARQPGARLRLLPQAAHDGPWESAWPGVLAELERLQGEVQRPAGAGTAAGAEGTAARTGAAPPP